MNDDRFDSNAERAPTRTAAARLLVDLDGRAFKVGVQSKAFSIGSDDACSLVVDRPGVAARHAVIQRDGDRFEIFDLLSSTGTFVNGRRVEAATLTSGDAIRVGDARLVFLRDEPAPPAPAKGTSEADATAVASLGFFEPTPPAPKADPETEATWTSFPPIVADAPLPEPLTPPRKPRYVGPDRRARTDFPEFGELLIFQLRRTPFMATSIVAHGILVVLVLLFAEPGKIPVLRGPTRTERFDYALVDETPPEATRDAPDIEAANPETPIGEPEFVESNDAPWGEAEELSSPTPEDLDLGPFRDVRGGVASAGSLDLGGLLGAASGDGPSLRRLSSDLKGVGLDVVLVVDATGSMGPVIEAARGARRRRRRAFGRGADVPARRRRLSRRRRRFRRQVGETHAPAL
jgi:pSer/pThr/pTyr-binding forkhead associated (FHA) protein